MIPGYEGFPVVTVFWAVFILFLGSVPLIKPFGCAVAPARAAHPLQMPFAVMKTHANMAYGSVHVSRMLIGPVGALGSVLLATLASIRALSTSTRKRTSSPRTSSFPLEYSTGFSTCK
jgi:hypothetical protein